MSEVTYYFTDCEDVKNDCAHYRILIADKSQNLAELIAQDVTQKSTRNMIQAQTKTYILLENDKIKSAQDKRCTLINQKDVNDLTLADKSARMCAKVTARRNTDNAIIHANESENYAISSNQAFIFFAQDVKKIDEKKAKSFIALFEKTLAHDRKIDATTRKQRKRNILKTR